MLLILFGPDSFRLREKLKELKEKFTRDIDPSGVNLTVINTEKPTFIEIKKAITISSFLAKKRMIIIENVFSGKDKALQKNLLELIKNKRILKDTIIILVEEVLEDKKITSKKILSDVLELADYKQEFNLLSEGELSSWIKKRVKENKGTITNQATELLASYTGPDLWALNNEINKLIAYKNSKEIVEADIVDMVKAKINDNIFKLTDAVAQKNNKIAHGLINDFLQNGFSENYILNMLIYQFKNLLIIKSLREDNYTITQIRNETRLHPFVLQKTILQAKQFNLDEIKKLYNKLMEIDKKIKTNQAKPLVLFDLFLIEPIN